ncbi:tetratricopeptide repeat protein 1-like [Uloborus diversus]|uniref:tetratricopeptide repeat protein 1-like n=1 Tax=Uloborus diversus TaxID=327109 RepID=UPI00240A713E|nr:tetratricopeptide repeat protein 1-like [Uloborus diversus]
MEGNTSSNSTIIPEPESSASESFDLKDCSNALPKLESDESDDEFSDAKDECDGESEELELDEEAIIESHKNLSDEELERLKIESGTLKNDGNDHFKRGEYAEAVKLYTRAINICPIKYSTDRSILFSNRAAAKIGLEQKEEAVLDCNKAIELNPNYLKAVLRRAQVFRKLNNLESCLEDYKKVLELDPNNAEARQACATMPAEINERNEKLKQEMFGKLKELGNLCLKPFGLSTDNFKVVQDPNSGGYSVNFQNNGS